LGSGARAHLGLADARGELAQDEPGGGDVDDGEVGDDAVDDGAPGERQRAGLDDLRRAVLGGVLHDDDDPPGAVDQVHRAAGALDELAGIIQLARSPRSENLHRPEDGDVDVAAADHAEAVGAGEEAGAAKDGDRLLAGVDEVGIDLGLGGYGPTPRMPFSLCSTTSTAGSDVVGDEGRHADAEVDVLAVAQLLRGPPGDLLTGQHGSPLPHGAPLDALLVAAPLENALHEIPGRWTWSGSMAPARQLLDLGDRVLGGDGAERVEVAGGGVEDEVAVAVARQALTMPSRR